MARVSKKVSAAQREAENAPHRIWKTAIYARLSDFDDVLRDTESLQVQISYIKEYIDHRDDLMLLEANGLAAGKDHQFKGRYDAEKNAVIISLEKDEQSALSPQKCTT